MSVGVFPMEKIPPTVEDVEKDGSSSPSVLELKGVHGESKKLTIWQRLSAAGVEHRGSKPVPLELRTDTNYFNIFTTMCTPMLSILPLVLDYYPSDCMLIFLELVPALSRPYFMASA